MDGSRLIRSAEGRYWEIDLVRGIAVVMMITFHALFAVNYLGVYDVEVSSGFWRSFALATAILFVFLVGLSLSIHDARLQEKGGICSCRPYALRGLRIFALGLVITAATWLILREGYVVFGILHLIGLSIILSPPFFRHRGLALFTGIYVIALGLLLPYYPGPIWLIWLGFRPYSFYSIDYVPLFPWFGVVLLGLYAGGVLYPDGRRRWALPEEGRSIAAPLAILGRNSLLVYMVHVPLILLAIGICCPESIAALLG
ncbi:MAG: heparan-alpha-glucosaminide N-acetyltransferase [Methanomicrobiales archaeon]|nr:heparan-alpha-glucosaminide N-acetyltransferase [Methanomicrobiales archaeon]MDI6876501.1 heparan-alpha-glucosaminide N-acetyltransferase [Methanomicrobiales archaeon]